MPDDVGTKPTRAEAVKLGRWMAKGGFATRIERRADGYHVISTGYNAKGKSDHEQLRGTRSHD